MLVAEAPGPYAMTPAFPACQRGLEAFLRRYQVVKQRRSSTCSYEHPNASHISSFVSSRAPRRVEGTVRSPCQSGGLHTSGHLRNCPKNGGGVGWGRLGRRWQFHPCILSCGRPWTRAAQGLLSSTLSSLGAYVHGDATAQVHSVMLRLFLTFCDMEGTTSRTTCMIGLQ